MTNFYNTSATVILNTLESTFVSSAFPNTKFSTNPVIYAGTDTVFQNTINFLRYTLPSLPVSEVDSAILQLSVIIKAGVAPSPVIVNRVTSPLDTETVTYQTRPTYIPTSSQIGITTGDLNTTVQVDLTELVNRWINGTFLWTCAYWLPVIVLKLLQNDLKRLFCNSSFM